MKKIIVIILSLMVLGASTFAGVYYVTAEKLEKEEVVKEAFYDIGEIFVNLKDNDGKRYVKLRMSVSYDIKNKELSKEIEEKKVVLRDTAIFYTKSRLAREFNSDNEKNLKKDLVNEINQNLTSGSLIDVYISDIIVQ